jgi:cytidine deaminase
MKTTANLVIQAQKAMQNAYAPYSKFHVGAAIIDENNRLHTGCNVENSAYPLGTCAEASAISSMVLSGGRLIKQIMLVSSGEFMVTPCGGCRQKIKEFCDDETEILIAHNDTITTFNIEDLLPHSFCKKHLNK